MQEAGGEHHLRLDDAGRGRHLPDGLLVGDLRGDEAEELQGVRGLDLEHDDVHDELPRERPDLEHHRGKAGTVQAQTQDYSETFTYDGLGNLSSVRGGGSVELLRSVAGHDPTLYQGGLHRTRQLELLSAKPLRNGAVAMHYRRAG